MNKQNTDPKTDTARDASETDTAAADERAPQKVSKGYGGDTGYVEQEASDTIDPNEPGQTAS